MPDYPLSGTNILTQTENRDPQPITAALGGQLMGVAQQLARTIVVVSVAVEDHWHGMTADSFMVASVDPPLVLFSVIAGGRTHRLLSGAQGFAVSVLAAEQRATAAHFASRRRPPGRTQFASVSWRTGMSTGAPILSDALCWLDCRLRETVPAGDHVLVLGEVLHIGHRSRRIDPLIRLRGGYPRMCADSDRPAEG